MANIKAKIQIKYQTRRFNGNKEVEQHFQNFTQEIQLSEDNFVLLKAAIEGTVDAANGSIE